MLKLSGRLEELAKQIETGETIKFGYFAQKGLKYKEEQRVIDFIKDISESSKALAKMAVENE